jgi:hypothetical protein
MTTDQDQIISTCGKVTYDSFFDAKKVLSRFVNIGRAYGKTKRRLATKKPKRIYKCPACGKYHLTSQKNKN